MNIVVSELEQLAGRSLVQREPYPVVAPSRTELLPEIMRLAQRTNQKVLVLGGGSSFDEQFSLVRDNIIAITTTGLTGIKKLDEFSYVVGPGTPVRELIDGIAPRSKTVGGFIGRQLSGDEREARKQFMTFVKAMEVVDGSGRFLTLPGPASSSGLSSTGCEQLCGTCGRCGIITAINLSAAPPISIRLNEDSSTIMSLASAGRPPFARETLTSVFDPHESLRW